MSDSFSDDAAFFGAVSTSGTSDGYFGLSAAAQQALAEGAGTTPGGRNYSGPAAPSFEDVDAVIDTGLSIFDRFLPLIGMGLQAAGDSNQPYDPTRFLNPNTAPPAAAPPQTIVVQTPPPTEPAGMSSGMMVLGGVLGLGLFGTLITLLVRRTGSANEMSPLDFAGLLGRRDHADFEDIGFSQGFVDFD